LNWTISNFQKEDGNYYCKETLYMTPTNSGKYLFSYSSKDSYGAEYTNSYSLTDQTIVVPEEGSTSEDAYKPCSYGATGSIVIRYNNKDVKTNVANLAPNTQIITDYHFSDFANGCPEQVYTASGSGYYGVFLQEAEGRTEVKNKELIDAETNNPGDNIVIDPETGKPINCSDFLYTDKDTGETVNLISELFNIIMIIGPILALVLGGLDFAKATLQSDENALKKAGTNFGKRIIAAALLFLLPFIINLILGIASNAGVFEGMEKVPDVCLQNK
jgi:hypothetical protein